MIVQDWDQFPNFSREEFLCKCGCGLADMDNHFIGILQYIRTITGVPMDINSGFRCPEHNNEVSKSGLNGPHTTGKAADIRCYADYAFSIMKIAILEDVTGFGFKQKGSMSGRFIHLDMLNKGETSGLRPRIWSY